MGPALSGVLAKVSYTAPVWAAAAITLVATLMAWLWLPETVHRSAAGTGMPFRNVAAMMKRPGLRRVLWIDFIYWFAFAIFQTTFALFVEDRFGFDVSQTGYFFAAFGVLGAVVQGVAIRPIVHRLGDKPTFILGVVCAAVGLVGATLAHTVLIFTIALIPMALGIGFGHPTVSSLVSRAGRGDEQGRVQGAAGAMESLGRAIGPVWGNAALQRFGDGMPYLSAAVCLAFTLLLSATYTVTDSESAFVR
jgi:DHA1 family tetracycline resistance protein-like MFS transporter